MSFGNVPLLGSIEAVRPVYLIVMGVFLMVIAWRLAKSTTGWTARTIVSGALMLGFGYALLIPFYETGLIARPSPHGHVHGDPASALAWHAVKTVMMNGGWLLFGIGLAMHAKVFAHSPAPRPNTALRPATPHEFTS